MSRFVHTAQFRIIGPVLLFAFVEFFFRLEWYLSAPLDMILKTSSFTVVAALISWQTARWTVLQIQLRYPGLSYARRRFFLLLAVTPVLANLAWIMSHSLWFLTDGSFLRFDTVVDYSRTLGIQFFCHWIYYAFYEGSYLFQQWKQDYVEKEELEKVNLRRQLSSLQLQINPHFLFNSFNTLSSLISESPKQAEEFVEEMSSVYRYLLRDNEQNLTTLATELEFISSYFLLLQTRHGKGLTLTTKVDKRLLNCQLPPLTLQLLVENAVKHNVVLAEQPLHISIETDTQHRLTVCNNLQHRKVRAVSNGVGLSNILAKYEMLGLAAPVIQDDGLRFTVLLPLME
ncbi:MAG: histidine kinase [Spirosomataceae bacterium]